MSSAEIRLTAISYVDELYQFLVAHKLYDNFTQLQFARWLASRLGLLAFDEEHLVAAMVLNGPEIEALAGDYAAAHDLVAAAWDLAGQPGHFIARRNGFIKHFTMPDTLIKARNLYGSRT